jgi:uncharacterized protein (DUF2141 family)
MMSRAFSTLLLPLAALAVPAPAGAAMVGDVAACASGEPSLKVRVSGLKEPRGTIRVRLYAEDGWLKRGRSLSGIRVPVTGTAMDLCVRVPSSGRYAVALHHDLNANRERDRSDGAGFSRNPRLSLIGRPSFAGTRVEVGTGVTLIVIQMMYLRGLAIGPVRSS